MMIMTADERHGYNEEAKSFTTRPIICLHYLNINGRVWVRSVTYQMGESKEAAVGGGGGG